MATRNSPTSRRYTAEFKERAVRLVRDLRAETGQEQGTIQRIASQLGCGVESLRGWVKQAEIDAGVKPGTTTTEAARIRELEQENRELRRANAILKSASAFFAAELDRPQR
jgi:transposase